jgi:hypothetical protein
MCLKNTEMFINWKIAPLQQNSSDEEAKAVAHNFRFQNYKCKYACPGRPRNRFFLQASLPRRSI